MKKQVAHPTTDFANRERFLGITRRIDFVTAAATRAMHFHPRDLQRIGPD